MKDALYKYAPVFIQNIGVSLYGLYWKNHRLGGVFQTELENFKLREKFSQEQWFTFQTLELRKLLLHSFQTVPFYTEKYAKYGFSLNDFKRFELNELKDLPILEKEELRKYGSNSLLSSKKRKGRFFSSSGSTGTPVSIYFSKHFHQKWSAAYECRVRNWAGVDFKTPRGMIGGRRILPESVASEPYFRYNIFEKQTYFSAYHISKLTIMNYVEGLFKNKVEYMVGYAMSIYFMSDFILNENIKSPKLKAVLTSSEKLTFRMRNSIEKAFQCKVFDAYSGIEACGLISENQYGDLLFSPDTGIMEIIDQNGDEINYGETGNVIATGFINYDQPLIRYNIGDRVKLSKNQQTKSGLNMLKIDEIEGRTEDVIIGEDGRKMVRFHSLFVNVSFLKQAQIIQHSLNKIELKIVKENGFSIVQENQIRERLKSQLINIDIEFNYVIEIPMNKNGKYQAVISRL